jgi:indole-3-glycerol phosphate synthase
MTVAPVRPARPTRPARPAVGASRNVVVEIAARRRADLAETLASAAGQVQTGALTPPRPIVERLAAPGLHLIAEIKRSSPSAGRIAGTDDDIVARARAYEAGGAAAISVLCEPHWFGGSIDDLRAIRAAVAIPVLA